MSVSVLICTPCFGGNIRIEYMNSIMGLITYFQRLNIKHEMYCIPFESLIPRARNVSATKFLKSDHTHMMFIDADIQFDPRSVLKMISEDKDIIGGAYPKKVLKFDQMKKYIDKANSIQDIIALSSAYAINVSEEQTVKNGVVSVLDAPTGFLLIKKRVIEKMIEEYPDTKYKNDIKAYEPCTDNGYCYDLFQSKVMDGRYVSEDYGFCRLWQNIGGKVHCDLSAKLTHFGNFGFIGNPLLLEHAKQNNR